MLTYPLQNIVDSKKLVGGYIECTSGGIVHGGRIAQVTGLPDQDAVVVKVAWQARWLPRGMWMYAGMRHCYLIPSSAIFIGLRQGFLSAYDGETDRSIELYERGQLNVREQDVCGLPAPWQRLLIQGPVCPDRNVDRAVAERFLKCSPHDMEVLRNLPDGASLWELTEAIYSAHRNWFVPFYIEAVTGDSSVHTMVY